MSLKEITADLHDLAEHTPFMQAVFEKSLPMSVWEEWTYWRFCFYYDIEEKCERAGFLNDLPGLKRARALMQDYRHMRNGNWLPSNDSTNSALLEYEAYLKTITPQQALAHLYVWHMGDLYGGQMIKKLIPAPTHYALEFDDVVTLRNTLRSKLTDDLGAEARTAFEYAIKMLNSIYHE
jgi:heme oxygenase